MITVYEVRHLPNCGNPIPAKTLESQILKLCEPTTILQSFTLVVKNPLCPLSSNMPWPTQHSYLFLKRALCEHLCASTHFLNPPTSCKGIRRYVHLKSHYHNAKGMYTQISDCSKDNNEKYWIRNHHHNKIWFFLRHLNLITANISATSTYCKHHNVLSINKGSLLVCHVEISQMMVHLLTLLILLESPLLGHGASRLFHNV